MAAFEQTEHDQFDDEYKSKSYFKREAEQLQALGEALVNLGVKERDLVPLDEELQDAVELARRIRNKHEAYRRQLQFIGKLMRNRDPEPFERALAQIRSHHAQANRTLHHLEQWRDRLLSDGDNAINALMAEAPQLDRQQLRQLVRQATKEQQQQKPPKAARALFRLLRDTLAE